MSNHSYSSNCPNCVEDMDSSTGNSPTEYTNHQCLYCGFYSFTTVGYQSLIKLNEIRENEGLEPLLKLPEQNPF